MRRARPTTMTMSEARAAFAKVLTRAERGDPVQVTRAGRPVAMIVSLDHYRAAGAEGESVSHAFRTFMASLDRKPLRGPDPWDDVRDRSPGREFRW